HAVEEGSDTRGHHGGVVRRAVRVVEHPQPAASAVPELEGPAFAEEKTAHGVLDAGRNGDEPEADQQGRRKGQARDGKGGPPEGGGAVVGHGAQGRLGRTRRKRRGNFKAFGERDGRTAVMHLSLKPKI